MGSLFRSATLWWQRGPLIQLWDDCANIEQVYQAVLAESGVPESELGLSAYVSLRGYGCRVESPAFSLMEALEVRWRLQRARDTSWDSFRAEWIRLLCAGRKHLSIADAAGFADCARWATLERALQRALCRVELTLGQVQYRKSKTS